MYSANNSEQLRELSSNDLNFLENETEITESEEEENGNSNSAVRDLDNILDKFEADTQILLDNPNQLLNCKYLRRSDERRFSLFNSCRSEPIASFLALSFLPIELYPRASKMLPTNCFVEPDRAPPFGCLIVKHLIWQVTAAAAAAVLLLLLFCVAVVRWLRE